MQSQPRCHQCAEDVEDPIFESLCGHEECPSSVFHPLCLMEWREEQVETSAALRSAGLESAVDAVHQVMLSAVMKLMYGRGQYPSGEPLIERPDE